MSGRLSAYGRKVPAPDAALTAVGPGTPMGELLRRYWQPVGLSDELADLPRRVRVMGEDLVLFREKGGRAALLELHCAHRGASLEWGKVEAGGIRCCYHGWKFDPDGRCVEMPCEPPGYARRRNVRQAGYPVQEYGGLVFAYMGPPGTEPLLPMYDVVAPGRGGVRVRGMRLWDGGGIGYVKDCNWLQHYENSLDPWHLVVLHEMIAGPHFDNAQMGARPEIGFERTPLGVRYRFVSRRPNGLVFTRCVENVVPNVFLMPDVRERAERPLERAKATEVSWVVPVDDGSLTAFSLVAWPLKDGRPDPAWRPGTDTDDPLRPGSGRRVRSYEERQRRPDDAEAQEGQRRVAVHALEHLAGSDAGIVMLRRLLRESVRRVARGLDPMNVVRDARQNASIETGAWNEVSPAPAPRKRRAAPR